MKNGQEKGKKIKTSEGRARYGGEGERRWTGQEVYEKDGAEEDY